MNRETDSLQDQLLQYETRRHFFERCGIGVGSMALGSLVGQGIDAEQAIADPADAIRNPLAPKQPHFPAKAKSIIFLFMAGGPSQLEMWDYKPKLAELNGQMKWI